MAENILDPTISTEVEPIEDSLIDPTVLPEETAEAVGTEPTPPEEQSNYQKWAVSHMEVKDVETLHNKGKLTDDDVERYTVEREIRDDFWNMPAASVEYALDNGLLTDRQFSHWEANRNNPIQFNTKDMIAGVATGIVKLGENVGSVLDQLVTSIVNPVKMYQSGSYRMFEAEVTGKESFAPATAKGKTVEVLSQFLIPFLAEAKLFKVATGGAKIAEDVLSSKAGVALFAKAPKLATFLAHTVENASLGMGTDFVAFDPFEPGITEFLDDAGILPEYMTFMAADDDDPIAWARLKRSMESALVGMGVGMVIDVVAHGVRLLKANAMRVKFGNPDKIAADGLKVEVQPERIIEPKSLDEIEAQAAIERSELNRGVNTGASAEEARLARLDKQTVKEQRGTPTEHDVAGTDDVVQSPLHPKSAKTRAEAAETVKWIKEGKDGHLIFDTSINFDKIHDTDEIIAMLKYQAHQSSKAVKKVKGAPLTTVKLDHAAAKISAEFGKHSPTSVVKMAEEKLGITGLHEAAQFINGLTDYVLQIDKEIMHLVKYGTDAADMLKGQYLAEQSGQLLKYLETASTDSGRLLWSFKRMRQAGKSLMNLSKEELEEMKGLHGNQRLLKMYADIKDASMRRKLTKTIATGRIQQGVLEYVQATLVWGMNTFKVNITGNLMAMASKAVNQFIGVAGEAIQKGDLSRLSGEMKHYFNGLRDGFADSLRFEKGERMGKVWKVYKTGEPQLDASAKFEGQNLHVLKHYSHKAAVALSKIPGIKIADRGINIADIYTMSFRNLTATDELFKNLNYNTSKQTSIFREAYEQHGKDTAGRLKAIKDMNVDLPDSIHKEAWDNARKNTYTETPSAISRWILKGANLEFGHQFGKHSFTMKPFFMMRVVALPFVNIADNLIRFTGRHTPFAIVGKEWQDMYKAGGARRKEAFSRVAMGTGLTLSGIWLHQTGKATGMIPVGDSGKSMYNNWRDRNVTPYSLINKVDERITGYSKFAPGALLVSLGANMSTAFEMYGMKDELHLEWDDLLFKVMMPALLDPVLEQHYLKSMKDVMDIVMQPDRTNPKKALLNQVPKFVPFSMLITQAKTDLVNFGWSDEQGEIWVKDINTLMDKINQVYNEDDLLPMRHSIYGTKIPQLAKSWGAFSVGATQRHTEAFTPGTVENEMGINKLNIGKMPEKLLFDKYDIPIELTPRQYDEVLENLEKLDVKGHLETLIKTEGYQNEPPKDPVGQQNRRIMMQELISGLRAGAKAQFQKDNPAFFDDFKYRMETKFNLYREAKDKHINKETKEFINGE